MTEDPHQPRNYDAVLGNQALPPTGGAVLGGLAGLKLRFSRFTEEQKISALSEALKHGEAGLDLVIQALGDSSPLVQWNAYYLLQERPELNIKEVLQEYWPSISPIALECNKLGSLLAVGNWKEADLETVRMMLRVSGKNTNSLLKLPDIERLPHPLLDMIDRLWLGRSNGQFGLSVQHQIWQDIGGNADADYQTWYHFCDRVGWRVNNCWVPYEQFTFGLDAPKGHLPFLAVGGFGVVICLHSLFSRLETR